MDSTLERGPTKLTAKLYAPMYADLDSQLSRSLLRRDAFLDRMIWQEIPHLREDLSGRRLSTEANRHISKSLKKLGGDSAPPLRTVSIAVRYETAEALRTAIEEHNLVRDAFLNRLVALLRSSNKLLNALGLPTRVTGNRRDGTEDASTSPLRAIEETLADPFYYLRSACQERYGCGLYLLDFPAELVGLTCFMADDEVPGTQAYSKRSKENRALLEILEELENNLSPTTAKGV